MAGGNKTTTTSTSEPYAAFKPMLDQVGKDLPGLYDRGGFAPVYTGSTVVPYSQQTMGAFKGATQTANALRPAMQSGVNSVSGILQGGGFNDRMNQGASGMQGVSGGAANVGTGAIDRLGAQATASTPWRQGYQNFASGAGSIDTGRMDSLGNRATASPYQGAYQGFAGGSGDVSAARMSSLGAQAQNNPMTGLFNAAARGAQDLSSRAQTDLARTAVNNPSMSGFRQLAGQTGPSYSEENLSSIAKGSMLGGGDPYFEDVLKRASEEARFAADRTASGMGRYGSDDHYGAMAKDITDLQLQARSDQYNRERAAQMAANAQLDQFRLADDASRLSALSGLGNTYATGQGQALNAANAASQIASGNRDARMQAGQIGSGIYQTGINQALGAAGNVANIQAGNQDRRMRGLDAGASDFRSGIGQGLQAAGLSAGTQASNQDRMMRGLDAGAADYRSGIGQGLQAAGLSSGIQSGNRDRQVGAMSQLFDMGQAGINNRLNATNALGGAYGNVMNTFQPQFNYGSALEDLYGRQLNDQIRIEQGQQNQGVDSLRNLMGLFGGGQFASQTQTAQGPNNTLSNIAGLGLGGLSLLGGARGWW